ncbi:MAG: hypothetical protein ABWX94_02280 [Candidatus Saccharimonadales bacterium]
MSRTRQTTLSGLLGSKRFIVAVCAAIAMVLGAMSVGASIFVPQSSSSDQQAANSPVFTERKQGSSTTTPADGGVFTKQHTLVPSAMPAQQPQSPTGAGITIPRVKAGLSIEFGPVSTGTSISLGGLQLNVESNSLAPIIDPVATPALTDETPTTPPAEEPPKETTPPEDSTPPPVEEVSPLSASMNTMSTTPPAEPAQ